MLTFINTKNLPNHYLVDLKNKIKKDKVNFKGKLVRKTNLFSYCFDRAVLALLAIHVDQILLEKIVFGGNH